MITPSFGLTATERVLPKLALDFTTASLDGRVTFTRTTDATHPATYINNSGLVTFATNNQPRFDFDPITLACKGLLIEESRANLLSYSNNFASGFGLTVVSNATYTASAVVSPDGTQNSDSYVSTNYALLRRDYTGVASTVYTYSVWIKSPDLSSIQIYCFDTAKTVTLSNSWQRFTVTGTANGSSQYIYIGVNSSFPPNKTICLYGQQLEAGAFPTSYIPTTSAALTRNADVATMTGTNFSSWYNASQGTFVYKGISSSPISNGNNQVFFDVNDGTANNRFRVFRNASNGVVQLNSTSNGVADVSLGSGVVAGYNTVINVAATYKVNSFAIAANASNTAEDNSASVIVSPNILVFNASYSFATIQNGWVQKLNFYSQRLTNSEITAFSK